MASVTISDIFDTICDIEQVDLRKVAAKKSPRAFKNPEQHAISICQYHHDLESVTGPRPTFSLLVSTWESSKNPFFREACAYLPEQEELYITSNLLQPSNSGQLPVILISKVRLSRNDAGDVQAVEWQKLRPPSNMSMPASGTEFKDGILFCSQGGPAQGTGGLYYMPWNKPPRAVVTNFAGWDFNSVHDVVQARDGSLWFTDPCHGFDKDFRPQPQLPCQVYRYVPDTGDLRVVADGIGRPHGIAFNPDESIVYITDTDAFRGGGEHEPMRAATIYAFDVIKRSGSPFLANKRVFAFALSSIPMGIVCDDAGNVYTGCADGIEIWNAGGSILGVIEVPGGVASLSFGKDGELFVCSEQRLWRVKLAGRRGSPIL
ncbi:D-lactonohydrolase-like protein-like protein [Lasiosphaeria hispida]|uniref:D-lactonohydrolase-like protein-like protein n=1 Tax=Lasiosphaeria hispida TaxID=260671 RepID=A0AAJ0HHE5_9PEZI|nr:D-lactonohydrolase-like protein-like protein [Lasiosphaeria hispida]